MRCLPIPLIHRLQAAIYLKNSITKRWCLNCNEVGQTEEQAVVESPISPEEKEVIRSTLISLLVTVHDSISKQLIESTLRLDIQ